MTASGGTGSTRRHPADALLHEHAGGVLDAARRARVERHLAGCADCRVRYDALEALRAELAGLPREVAPDSDLWSGIRAVIAEPVIAASPARAVESDAVDVPAIVRSDSGGPLATLAAQRSPGRRVFRSRAAMALAAVALVVIGAASWLAFAGGDRGSASGLTTAAADRFAHLEAPYVEAAAELVAALERRRDELPSDVAAPFASALALIDEAVRETRSAVAADPDNEALADMALAAHRRKLEFLQRVTQWSSEE